MGRFDGVGVFFVICASTRSSFFIYQLFVARSQLMMGDRTYSYHQFVGVVIILVGILMIIGVI